MLYQNFYIQEFNSLWFFIIFIVLMTAIFLDLKNRKIPNWLTFGGIGIMFIYLFLSSSSEIFQSHFWGFLFGSFIFITFFKLGIWGGGDAKLMMFISLSFGVYMLFSVTLCIFIIGGFQAIINQIFFKEKYLPYALSIGIGTLGYILSSYALVYFF